MDKSTPNFSLDVAGVEGICPAGEKHAQEQMAEEKIPVLSCEGPCIRGEIARRAANMMWLRHPGMPAVAMRKRSWSRILP